MQDAIEARLVGGLWQVVAAHGWSGLTLRRLAAASGLPAAEVRRLAQGPEALLRLHGAVLDRAVQAGTVPNQGGTPRDRVFDVLMRRIDAMQPHRAGLVRLLRELPRHPLLALCLARDVPAAMARMLDAAELSSTGIGGAMRQQGLAGVWLATLRAWMADEGADLGATMAALDRALDRAEQVARSLRLDPGDREAGASEPVA